MGLRALCVIRVKGTQTTWEEDIEVTSSFESQAVRELMRVTHKPSFAERILSHMLIHKGEPIVLPMGPALELLEQQGNIEGDYIIFSKKVWEKFKEGWK